MWAAAQHLQRRDHGGVQCTVTSAGHSWSQLSWRLVSLGVRVSGGGPGCLGQGQGQADDGVTREREGGESPDTVITDTSARGEARRRPSSCDENTKCGAERAERGEGAGNKSRDSDIEATCPAHCLSLID